MIKWTFLFSCDKLVFLGLYAGSKNSQNVSLIALILVFPAFFMLGNLPIVMLWLNALFSTFSDD